MPAGLNRKPTSGEGKIAQMLAVVYRDERFQKEYALVKAPLEQTMARIQKEIQVYPRKQGLTGHLLGRVSPAYPLALTIEALPAKTQTKIKQLMLRWHKRWELDESMILQLVVRSMKTANPSLVIPTPLSDLCEIENWPENSDEHRVLHKEAYPFFIAIHRYASERDILDFVKKRWGRIHGLQVASKKAPPRIAMLRKLKPEIVDYIKANSSKSGRKLQHEVYEQFGLLLDYSYINKVRSTK